MPPSRPRNSARNGWGSRGNCPAKAALAMSWRYIEALFAIPAARIRLLLAGFGIVRSARAIYQSTDFACTPGNGLRRRCVANAIERNRIALILQPLEQLQEVLRLT